MPNNDDVKQRHLDCKNCDYFNNNKDKDYIDSYCFVQEIDKKSIPINVFDTFLKEYHKTHLKFQRRCFFKLLKKKCIGKNKYEINCWDAYFYRTGVNPETAAADLIIAKNNAGYPHQKNKGKNCSRR